MGEKRKGTYVPFHVNRLLAVMRDRMPGMPYLRDRADELVRLLPIEEVVFILQTSRRDMEVVIFTSCRRDTQQTRKKGTDRVRICYRRWNGDEYTWCRIRRFNRTKGTVESVAQVVCKSMDGQAAALACSGTLREALDIDLDEPDDPIEPYDLALARGQPSAPARGEGTPLDTASRAPPAPTRTPRSEPVLGTTVSPVADLQPSPPRLTETSPAAVKEGRPALRPTEGLFGRIARWLWGK